MRHTADSWSRCALLAMVPVLVLLSALRPSRAEASTSCVSSVAAGTQSVLLNELLPLAASDWNGDGVVSSSDTFVELFNTTSVAQSLFGWSLTAGGTFSFSKSATIPAGGLLVVYGSTLGSAQLSPTGGYVALSDSSGTVVDDCTYPAASPNISFARLPDGSANWGTAAPTPGLPNGQMATPTPTPLA